jgi:hypothetical protein
MVRSALRSTPWTAAFAGLALALLVCVALAPALGWLRAAAVAVVVGLLAAIVARRRAGEGSGTVWDAIPSRQYAGRHAESGGLARAEQERALERTREAAEEMERRGRG